MVMFSSGSSRQLRPSSQPLSTVAHRASASASAAVDRQPAPSIAITNRDPPVRPMRAAGTPAAARRVEHRVSRVGLDADDRRATPIRRTASPPADRRRRRKPPTGHRRRRRCRRCRSNIRPAPRPSRPRRNRAPIEQASRRQFRPAAAAARARAPDRAPAASPRSRPCTVFRYSLPPSSPRFSPSSTMSSPGCGKHARAHAARVLEHTDDADDGRRQDRPGRPSRCRG